MLFVWVIEYLLNIAWLANFVLKDILYRFYKTFKNFKTKSTRNPVLSPKKLSQCSNYYALSLDKLITIYICCHFEVGTKINCLLLMIQMCVYVRMQTYLYLLIVLLENIPKLVYFLHCMLCLDAILSAFVLLHRGQTHKTENLAVV